MSEFIGYRANAKAPLCGKVNDGFVTVYAERRNSDPSLGEYGGDAYPVVSATDKNNVEYGIILAADGVGQAAFQHPSLNSRLSELISGTRIEDDVYAKLSAFLRSLYGAAIFDAKNEDVLDYAIRCFGDIPTDGFFASPDEAGWKVESNKQCKMPFYERDSQSLGSRLLCVYIYLNFRNYMADNNITAWTEDGAAALRDEINGRIKNELAPKVLKLFDHADTEQTVKQMRYFLCSTVAVWFYAHDKATGKISALSLNCGDARTYVVDLKDGVRQISVDDAFADGSMAGFFHFGYAPKTSEGFCDNTLFGRIVETQLPCVLFACSDGVYDTCPAQMKSDDKKYSIPEADTDDANDFLFAKNMIEALRRSYSLEDFRREIVFNFYAMNKAQNVLESCEAGRYGHIKRDDSATLAARFFGTSSPLEILDALRATTDTSLDKLWDLVVNYKYASYRIPYYMPHATSVSDAAREGIDEYARNDFKDEFGDVVRSEYHTLFTSMKEAGAHTIWNAPHPSETELGGFFLTQKWVNVFANYVNYFNLAVSDWRELEGAAVIQKSDDGYKLAGDIPADWNPHEHVIFKKEIFDKLCEMNFAEAIEKLFSASSKKDKTGDVILALHAWFERHFVGETQKSRDKIWTPDDALRPELDDPTKVITDIIGDGGEAQSEAASTQDIQTGAPTAKEAPIEQPPVRPVQSAQPKEPTSTPADEVPTVTPRTAQSATGARPATGTPIVSRPAGGPPTVTRPSTGTTGTTDTAGGVPPFNNRNNNYHD